MRREECIHCLSSFCSGGENLLQSTSIAASDLFASSIILNLVRVVGILVSCFCSLLFNKDTGKVLSEIGAGFVNVYFSLNGFVSHFP